MTRFFQRWIELSEADQSYDGLKDLFLREHFMNTCSSELALFLRERVPQSMIEVTTPAEQYVAAHGSSVLASRTHKVKTDSNTHTQTRRCFVCNSESHLAKDCPSEKVHNQRFQPKD